MSACQLGLSPCPNDTFIFHALLHGLVPAPCAIRPHLADVEELNRLVAQGIPEFSKISIGELVRSHGRYALLSAGAALGFGCGPLLVARKDLRPEKFRFASIAIPGAMTTANLLLTLTGEFLGERREMLFSRVMDAVVQGETELGVIIHEGRFTYQQKGLVKVLDLGEWWEQSYHLPLPLGGIVVRRDVDRGLAVGMNEAIAQSLRFARKHPEQSQDYIRAHAQELSPEVIAAHIKTFVTDFSLDLGQAGRAAVTHLLHAALEREGQKRPAEGFFLENSAD
ncbi:MAG: 1,4-dihydroxy-6-naphthoate synthase [Desulfovibrio sp.]|nr:1,4-dihydroxy-6-naphthoate synthase [Desulfovibrio sp.]